MTVQISARVDRETKQKYQQVCERIGVSPSNVIGTFIKSVVEHDAIPFEMEENSPPPKKTPVRPPFKFGCMAGKIWMAEDFDAPLEDFKEYME